MRKIFFLLLVLTFLVGFTLPAGAVDFGVRGYWWFTSIDGDLRVDAGGLTGTKVDLENDLGMGDESYPIVEAFVGLGKNHLSLAYYRAEYDGTNVLTTDIVFNGEVFTVGDQISSKLNYDTFDFQYQYDFLNLENVLAGFSLSAVLRVEVFDGEAEIKSQTLGTTTREDFTAPIPMVGLNCHVGILADILEARVLATGLTYGDGSAIDAQADVSWTPFPFLDLHGGYRILYIDVDRSDVEASFSTSGPYVALTLSI